MNLRISQWLLALVVASASLSAAATDKVDKTLEAKLRGALEQPGMGVTITSIRASEVKGLYEIELADGPVLYSTEEGDYFVAGDLYSVGPKGFVNLGEQRRDTQRLTKLDAVAAEDMIIFPAEGKPRAHITVFTDVTCFYCRKLHQEVPELNKRGVEVRYMAYPRTGVGSDGYQLLVNAWCAENPQEALTKLKSEQSVPDKSCSDNPVTAQFQLGKELGVRGTPAIVSQDGQLISGYQPVDRLMVTLGLN